MGWSTCALVLVGLVAAATGKSVPAHFRFAAMCVYVTDCWLTPKICVRELE